MYYLKLIISINLLLCKSLLNTNTPTIDTTTNSPNATYIILGINGKLYTRFNSIPIIIPLKTTGPKLDMNKDFRLSPKLSLIFIININAKKVAVVPKITSISPKGPKKFAIAQPIVKPIQYFLSTNTNNTNISEILN